MDNNVFFTKKKGVVGTFITFALLLSTMIQFYQHFTCSCYARRYQKRKKYSQAVSIFFAFGSVHVKGVRKIVGEIDPQILFTLGQKFWS